MFAILLLALTRNPVVMVGALPLFLLPVLLLAGGLMLGGWRLRQWGLGFWLRGIDYDYRKRKQERECPHGKYCNTENP